MLHKTKDIILPETLELLKTLQDDPELSEFFLVGGTALALQLGHRFSVDLDLFKPESFDVQYLSQYLSKNFNFQIDSISKNTILGHLNGVKIDFITHAYPLVEPLIQEDSLTIASILDIAAMKLNAISISGQRLKDFIDVYFILEKYSLNQILKAYKIKYPNSNIMIPLKALTYFNDIDPAIDPPMMKKEVKLDTIKNRLTEAVNSPDHKFPNSL